jgi:hypothetical protein
MVWVSPPTHRPHAPCILNPLQLQHAVALCHERCTLRRVARVLSAPLSTVGRVLKALGLGRLRNAASAEPVRRYQWAAKAHLRAKVEHPFSGDHASVLIPEDALPRNPEE